MHNSHYEKLKIDTINLWKANKTLAQLIDACEFQIDKYNRRPKEGEEIKDCDKIIFYSELKKDCYMLAKSVGYELTYNDAFDLINKEKESNKDDLYDAMSYAFVNYNNKDLMQKQSEDDIYEVQEGTIFKAILGDKITIISKNITKDGFKFVVARLSDGTEARLSKDLLETSHFKKINP